MGVFEMVIVIVLVGAATSTLSQIMKQRHEREQRLGDPEAGRLRDEVTQLKERLAVLERITVEKENSLERQIESLRER
ncbi:hypothetical protein [Allosphingosinicella sp.]|uniref:hypothetical protein n=1 Tax=Allosphingosinicella sp. TaxID=2823234 RepID=UPI003D73EF5A